VRVHTIAQCFDPHVVAFKRGSPCKGAYSAAAAAGANSGAVLKRGGRKESSLKVGPG
jgi:hypothetical protein